MQSTLVLATATIARSDVTSSVDIAAHQVCYHLFPCHPYHLSDALQTLQYIHGNNQASIQSAAYIVVMYNTCPKAWNENSIQCCWLLLQVTLQTWFFLSYLMDSLAIAANGLVADGIGRGDMAAARAVALRCLKYGGGVSMMLLGSLATFPQAVAAIFTDSRYPLFLHSGCLFNTVAALSFVSTGCISRVC